MELTPTFTEHEQGLLNRFMRELPAVDGWDVPDSEREYFKQVETQWVSHSAALSNRLATADNAIQARDRHILDLERQVAELQHDKAKARQFSWIILLVAVAFVAIAILLSTMDTRAAGIGSGERKSAPVPASFGVLR